MPLPGSNRNPVFLQEIKEATHETPNLSSMTKKQLIAYAEGIGANVDKKMNKSALLQELTI